MPNSFARALAVLALSASTLEASGHLELTVQNGRVSLDAQATTVKEVLDALVAKSVVRVTMDEATAFRARLTTVNKRFARRDLATALDSILIEIPHELVRGADGSVAEVRLVSPLLRGRAPTQVTPVAPSQAAVRAGRDVAAGVVPATSLPPVTSNRFSLEARPEAAPPATAPAPVANALAARIAERRAAIVQRSGYTPQPLTPAAAPAPTASPRPAGTGMGDMPGAPPSLSTNAIVTAAAPKKVSNRPPIATPAPMEIPANPWRISGIEMPRLSDEQEEAAFRADRAAGKLK